MLNISRKVHDASIIWETLISFMHNEGDTIGHYPLWEKDFKSIENEEFNIINEYCDLTDLIFSVKDSNPLRPSKDTFAWNESLVHLGDKIKKTFSFSDLKNTEIFIDDKFWADAANSFEEENEENSVEWVKPFKDLNNLDRTYAAVRRDFDLSDGNKDLSIEAITNSNNLQFTAGQAIKQGIRLIMPKNSRRVQIEDLNRNFWVISQAIAAITSILFGDGDNNIPSLFKDIFSELLQLWENIIYLNSEIFLSSINNKIKTLVMPLPNNIYQPYRKFDNFDIAVTKNSVINKCKFLVDKYCDCHLIVLPYVRVDNWKKNYFKSMSFPYVLIYNNNKKEWKAIETNININNSLAFHGELLENYLYGIREDDKNFIYATPFKEIGTYIEDDSQKYFSLLRTRVNFSEIKIENNCISAKCSIKVYDAARQALYSNFGTELGEFSFNISENNDSITTTFKPKDSYSFSSTGGKFKTIQKHQIRQDDNNQTTRGFDLGEIISNQISSKENKPIVKNAKFTLVKIGDFYPLELAKHLRGSFNRIDNTDFPYDTATYGVGSYYNNYCSADTPLNASTNNQQELVFVPYYKQKNASGEKIHYYHAYDVTPQLLEKIGKDYIKYLINEGTLPRTPGIYATKIGVGYWTGDNGSQWSHGVVCDLFVNKTKGINIEHLGRVNLFDGYWTNNESIFTRDDDGGRWRRLYMSCDKLQIISTQGEQAKYEMTNGLLAWFDHNKDIEGNYEDIAIRPRCSIKLAEDGSEILYSNEKGSPTNETCIVCIAANNKNSTIFTSSNPAACYTYSSEHSPKPNQTINLNGLNDFNYFYLNINS